MITTKSIYMSAPTKLHFWNVIFHLINKNILVDVAYITEIHELPVDSIG